MTDWLRSILVRAAERKYQIGKKYSPDQPRVPAGTSTGGQWAATGGGNGRVEARRAKITDEEAGDLAKRAADRMAQEVADNLKIERGNTPWSAELIDRRTGKVLASGHQDDIPQELDKRIRAARTKAERQALAYINNHNLDIEQGFYDDAPGAAARDRQRVIETLRGVVERNAN